MQHTYRFRFTQGSAPRVEDIHASGPVQALDRFHRFMQVDKSEAPASYKINTLHMLYNGSATKIEMVESEVDLPNSPNPTISKTIHQVLEDNTAMLEMDIPTGGKLSD